MQSRSPQPTDEILDPSAFDDSAPESLPQRSRPAQRRFLNLFTLIVLILGASVTYPWWQPGFQRIWSAWFPPPYTGSLVYGTYGGKLTAFRATDGRMQWVQNAFFATSQASMSPDLIVSASLFQGQPELVGVQPASGHLLWHTPYPASYNSPYFVGMSPSHVYVEFSSPASNQSPIFEVLARHTGSLLWSTPTTDSLAITPRLDDALVVFCGDGPANKLVVTARDAATGAMRWTATGPPPQTLNDGSNCYQSGAIVTLQAQQGATTALAAYALSDGRLLWQARDPGTITGVDVTTIYTSTSPRSTYFSVLLSPELTARDAATGRVMWQVHGDLTDLYATTPTATASAPPYYLAKSLTGVVAFAHATGKIVWQFNPVDDDSATWLALFDGRQTLLYAVRASLYAIDARSGQILWQRAGPPGAISGNGTWVGAIYAADQQIYLQDFAGVTALDAASGRLRWRINQSYQLIFP